MIDPDELTVIGHITKPHGVKGEMNLILADESIDPARLRCLVIEREGLPVPFFPAGVRRRGAQGVLLTLDGVADESAARAFAGAEVCAFTSEIAPMLADAYEEEGDEDADDDGERLYLSDLVGMEVEAGGSLIGTVTGIDDTTINVLMVVLTPQGDNVLIPVAEEYFVRVDSESGRLELELPEGLLP